MRMSEGYVTTSDGVRLYYRALGEGAKTLVIPNGFHLLEEFTLLTASRRLLVFDSRNRGRSDAVGPDQAARGIDQDVEDLESVGRHLELKDIDRRSFPRSAVSTSMRWRSPVSSSRCW